MSKLPFQDHAVWVTGASAGLGKSMALEFARLGANVALSGRRIERLEEVATEIEQLGRQGLPVSCDVTDDAEVARAADQVVGNFGKLDVVVANAGFAVAGRFDKLDIADWHRQYATNVFGLVSTLRHSLPALRDSRGRIAIVSSVAGLIATPKFSAYSSSKAAACAIGRTLALELHGSGVSCTLINPGYVATEIAQVDNQGNFDPSKVDRRPKGVMWSADDAARVMVRAIGKRKREFTFTLAGHLGAFFGQHLPGLTHFAMSRSGGK